MDLKDSLETHLNSIPTGPFFFIGSGFSRRYLNLETWSALLQRFNICGKDFAYYVSSANNSLPQVATLLAKDYHELWWHDPSFEQSRLRYRERMTEIHHPLKFEIGDYIRLLSEPTNLNMEYENEINLLRQINIDGVITTNWDLLLENLFPDFKSYIGQNSLLFSSPANIAEIYKIHGCCTDPRSLILTSLDYQDFNNKYAYLAAKLLTIFTEHPVIFLGYSLSDDNIRQLLNSLTICLGNENIQKLQDRLIIVEWIRNQTEATITKTYHSIDSIRLPITSVKTHSFEPIYEALLSKKRKIPLRILRYCKEQVYELVNNITTPYNVSVVDIDENTDTSDIEFVVGIGVSNSRMQQRGYTAITIEEIIEDIILDNKNYDPINLLTYTLPELLVGATVYIPVFKYLRAAGINDTNSYQQSNFQLNKAVVEGVQKLTQIPTESSARRFVDKSFREVIDNSDIGSVLRYIPMLNREKIDADELLSYLKIIFPNISQLRYLSNWRKVVFLYDVIKYGWETEVT